MPCAFLLMMSNCTQDCLCKLRALFTLKTYKVLFPISHIYHIGYFQQQSFPPKDNCLEFLLTFYAWYTPNQTNGDINKMIVISNWNLGTNWNLGKEYEF